MSVSPVTPTLPPTLPLSCNGSKGLATDSEGRGRITCQYLFPLTARIETDTLHSLSLFPLKPIQGPYLCLGSGGFGGSPGRKQTWQDSERGHHGRVRVQGKEGESMTNADKQRFYGCRMGVSREWTFPMSSLWNTNNERNHCRGQLLLYRVDYRLYHQYEQLLLLSCRLSLS